MEKESSPPIVQGFQFSGIHSGIKKSNKLDVGLIYSFCTTTAAAVFTQNTIAAAPIQISRQNIKNGKLNAILVNSGNANCFTGEDGLKQAKKLTEIVAEQLSINPKEVLIASTGIIGKPFPFTKIKESVPKLIENLGNNQEQFCSSILTTDTCIKQCHQEVELSSGVVHISGYAKGSGMVCPDMATILAFITTDISIKQNILQFALKDINEKTFNAITVDGCMSTNDMVVIMANGMAKNKRIINKAHPDFSLFYNGLEKVMIELAKMIVTDGEGAKNFIEIEVQGAKNDKQAKTIGMAIANSNLVKTANYHENPNLGRIIAAIGSQKKFEIKENDIHIQHKIQKDNKIILQVSLKTEEKGTGSFTVYTCDLTKHYITINNSYN